MQLKGTATLQALSTSRILKQGRIEYEILHKTVKIRYLFFSLHSVLANGELHNTVTAISFKPHIENLCLCKLRERGSSEMEMQLALKIAH